MTYQQIEIKHLDRSPLNVRKTEPKAAMEELKASLLAHGLMQNLVVVPSKKKGRYEVVAGGRRLEALTQLRDEGKLADDHAVSCRVVDSDEATELSLAENTIRLAMHPADEFEAFSTLIEHGQTAAQVAERFGTTERHVLQRMKLGRVVPELLTAYRSEEISLESLEAFAVTDDQQRQASVFKSLQGWQRDNANHIRKCLTDKMVESDDKLAVFVGLEAYAGAGGKTKADLFEDTSYLEDGALLQRLAGAKLDLVGEQLKAEGWGWVAVSLENDYSFTSRLGRIRATPLGAPEELLAERKKIEAEIDAIDKAIDAAWDTDDEDEQARLDAKKDEAEDRLNELDEKLEGFVAFDPDQMKLAGCYVTLSHNGELRVEKGLVKTEDKKKAGAGADANTPDSTAGKQKPEFSQSLIADLKAYRTQAAQAEIAMHPDIAFDLMVFHVACDVMDHFGTHEGIDVSFRQTYPSPSVEKEGLAVKRLETIEEALPKSWLEPEGEAERFHAFRQLTDADKKRILAYCTALTLKPALAEVDEPSAYEVALGLTGSDVAIYWRPTMDNYLSRITRDQLLAAGSEIMLGGKEWADSHRDDKKAALVEILDKAFAVSGKPDTRDAIKNWLPKGMEFRAVALPEAAPEKQPKRAKKAKQAA